jgi:hypothetical protein
MHSLYYFAIFNIEKLRYDCNERRGIPRHRLAVDAPAAIRGLIPMPVATS